MVDEVSLNKIRNPKKREKIRNICETFGLDTTDAIIISYLDEAIDRYELFLNEVIHVGKDEVTKTYKVGVKLTDYYNEIIKITNKLINLDTILREGHPEVAQVLNSDILGFMDSVKNIPTVGSDEDVLKKRVDFFNFRLKLANLIKSGNPEKLMDSYMLNQEERASKLWTRGLAKLHEHEKALALVYQLIRDGKGIMMTKDYIAQMTGVQRSEIDKELALIRKNAPELLDLTFTGGKMHYCIQKPFHNFYMGRRL
jgi:hypothetical protein